MTKERAGATTFLGNPLTLLGEEVQVGKPAPDFTTLTDGLNMTPYSLEDGKGHVRIISVVVSVDTPTCDAQTRRFNDEVAKIPGAEVLTVSADLPFSQARWAKDARMGERVKMLSDYRDLSFGAAYGIVVKELRLLGRAIIVVDADNNIVYTEYVKELADPPNYDAALAAAKQAAGL